MQGAGGVQEVPPQGFGGCFLLPGQLEREQPVEVSRHDGERGVQVDVLVGLAADPPGVGAQVGGLGQRGQPEREG